MAVAVELAVDVRDLGPFPVSAFGFLSVMAASDASQVLRFATSMDPGEAEAVALALELRADELLMDDVDARRVAEGLGLQPVGVLALLVRAKKRGEVAAVGPLITRLKSRIRFRASEALVRRVFSDAGEAGPP